ncbi:radical SAM family heme chaperone HemW [Staphylococcus canis]|uniref:Heme chaperone HemW n=1 Tax=Staphylococcus canis TaxID=2724942 RepID=A0ABS0TDE4_9STAP|nr:radical SAM family heme chaperone HemW [Staphylococcus canis]MBI5975763.1 oxygen-independent coproporphyrinogen III oxidase [Staphylococcus canis]
MTIHSAYVHIPFCVRICTYCDFNKYFIQNQPVDEYIECLIEEMRSASHQDLETFYVGGGTPTALSDAQLERLLKAISSLFNIKGEYTFEANPDELTETKIRLLKQYGVNRLSLGVQTFDKALLKKLGRSHQASDIFKAVNIARDYGIPSISLDLMYDLPGQSLGQFQESLKQALALDIDHISSYGLIVEPQTQFYNLYRKGKLELPDEDVGQAMYQLLIDNIEQSDLHQYEISNFAKEGHESEHNKVYWKNEQYYGFGAGASGYIDNTRYTNVKPVNHYIQKIRDNVLPRLNETTLSRQEQIEEEMFLGLRMAIGVNKERFKHKFGTTLETIYSKELEELEDKGLITNTDGYVSLTGRGKVIGNEVFEAFIKG